MSKNIILALLSILIGIVIWGVTDYLHSKSGPDLPPNIESKVTPVDPTLDITTLNQFKLDRE